MCNMSLLLVAEAVATYSVHRDGRRHAIQHTIESSENEEALGQAERTELTSKPLNK